MSLDVRIKSKEKIKKQCIHCDSEYETDETLCWLNITHNLGAMADAAGLYMYLWRPEEIHLTKTSELIEPLKDGLEILKANRQAYMKLNPKNGWGSYETLVEFVEEYLAACKLYPDALIEVSR